MNESGTPHSALVCENDPKDLLTAIAVLRSFGIETVTAFDSSYKAQRFLGTCVAGEIPLPVLLIVDLDLQQESGYDLIRYWCTTRAVAKTPLIVWSILGEEHAEMCDVFKISSFVSKARGRDALAEALANFLPDQSD